MNFDPADPRSDRPDRDNSLLRFDHSQLRTQEVRHAALFVVFAFREQRSPAFGGPIDFGRVLAVIRFDTLVRIPRFFQMPAAGIKLPTTISLPTMESDARRIYRRLEQHARSGVAVAEGYVQLMAILQISMPLPAKAIETFSEFNYVRNCFLHRGGIVDERAAVEAPTLGLPLGAMIRISSAKYDQYFDAAAELTSALLKAVIESRYIKTK